MSDLVVTIKSLEEKILHCDFRGNFAALDRLIHRDFEEINAEGQSVTRQEVIEWLNKKDPDDRWCLEGFRIKKFGVNLVIALYHAKKIGNNVSSGSMRSSVWHREGTDWLLIHHHASKPTE